MNRRKLLKVAGVAAASTVISAPTIAQSTPVLRWRLTTSFPKTLDTLYGACEMFAKTMADLSDQKFQISVYGPGEIVPAFQVFDAVANNTVEMGNSASYYYQFSFGSYHVGYISLIYCTCIIRVTRVQIKEKGRQSR